jgi:hypothetical protein
MSVARSHLSASSIPRRGLACQVTSPTWPPHVAVLVSARGLKPSGTARRCALSRLAVIAPVSHAAHASVAFRRHRQPPHLSFFPMQVAERFAIAPSTRRRSTAESHSASSSWVSCSASASSATLSRLALHHCAATPPRRYHLFVLATAAHRFLLPLYAGLVVSLLEAKPKHCHSPVTRPTEVAPLPSLFKSLLKPHHLPVSCRRLLHPR